MENQKIKLTVTFTEKIYSEGKTRQLLETIASDRKETFSGKNKSDCRQQAKENFRTGVNWIESWN